jgi:hypothetical protein
MVSTEPHFFEAGPVRAQHGVDLVFALAEMFSLLERAVIDETEPDGFFDFVGMIPIQKHPADVGMNYVHLPFRFQPLDDLFLFFSHSHFVGKIQEFFLPLGFVSGIQHKMRLLDRFEPALNDLVHFKISLAGIGVLLVSLLDPIFDRFLGTPDLQDERTPVHPAGKLTGLCSPILFKKGTV